MGMKRVVVAVTGSAVGVGLLASAGCASSMVHDEFLVGTMKHRN